jgi:hypothetical protein
VVCFSFSRLASPNPVIYLTAEGTVAVFLKTKQNSVYIEVKDTSKFYSVPIASIERINKRNVLNRDKSVMA